MEWNGKDVTTATRASGSLPCRQLSTAAANADATVHHAAAVPAAAGDDVIESKLTADIATFLGPCSNPLTPRGMCNA